MKKLLIAAILFYFCFGTSKAQIQWGALGNKGFSNAVADQPFMAIDGNNVPFIIYRDAIAYSKASVMKFNGNSWEYVGNRGFSSSYFNTPSIAFDSSNTPYVAFTDCGNDYKISVMKFFGGSWVYVGTQGFTPDAGSFTSILFDKNDNLYVGFRDKFYGYRASVMKFNGVDWEYVGTGGFSDGTFPYGAANISLKSDSAGILFIGFQDEANDFKASVMKFDGANWEYVGSPGFSISDANNTCLSFDDENTPIIVYGDRAQQGKATVMKFDGIYWNSIGPEGFTPAAAGYTTLSVDKNNTLYVAFKDYSNGGKASLMKYDGQNWIAVGELGFSGGDAIGITSAVDGNGALYVGYSDSTTSPYTYGATVMKFDTITVTNIKNNQKNYSFKIFPNPSCGVFTLIYEDLKPSTVNLQIHNVLGQTVYSKTYKGTLNEVIDLRKQGKGIYYVEIYFGECTEVRKIIIE